ncbi:MAG: DUF805 domain-containing protein [Pseudomonadota bacterium]|jgi:uncharacterized membrane protein YhaH (DUF805 family)|nr:DUF805 domain-containing protein [Alphaproteobacteria bacterium]
MFEALKKYAVFSGRAQRKEYWLFALLCVLSGLMAGLIDVMLGTFSLQTGLGLVGVIVSLALFIPSLSVSVRRLHDTDRSGWWLLIMLVPFAGVIVLLVFFCLEGTPGANRFGPNPKAPALSHME